MICAVAYVSVGLTALAVVSGRRFAALKRRRRTNRLRAPELAPAECLKTRHFSACYLLVFPPVNEALQSPAPGF